MAPPAPTIIVPYHVNRLSVRHGWRTNQPSVCNHAPMQHLKEWELCQQRWVMHSGANAVCHEPQQLPLCTKQHVVTLRARACSTTQYTFSAQLRAPVAATGWRATQDYSLRPAKPTGHSNCRCCNKKRSGANRAHAKVKRYIPALYPQPQNSVSGNVRQMGSNPTHAYCLMYTPPHPSLCNAPVASCRRPGR